MYVCMFVCYATPKLVASLAPTVLLRSQEGVLFFRNSPRYYPFYEQLNYLCSYHVQLLTITYNCTEHHAFFYNCSKLGNLSLDMVVLVLGCIWH